MVTVNGIAKIARKLGIDYAEATMDFEFVKRRSVPVLQGIVVAKENEQILIEVNNNRDERRIRSHKRNFHVIFLFVFLLNDFYIYNLKRHWKNMSIRNQPRLLENKR